MLNSIYTTQQKAFFLIDIVSTNVAQNTVPFTILEKSTIRMTGGCTVIFPVQTLALLRLLRN